MELGLAAPSRNEVEANITTIDTVKDEEETDGQGKEVGAQPLVPYG